MPINLTEYFNRIGYKGTINVSEETFKNIHAAQIFSIPFENLSIHEVQHANSMGNIIKIDEESIFNKLVLQKRGGYCHENNELLALVLMQLGFKVERLAARVLTGPNLPISHKFLMVTIDNKPWIADVGFGGLGLFEPIPLVADQEFMQHNERFKLTQENGKFTLQTFIKNAWKKLYEFTTTPVAAADFEMMNYYVSHHPDSIFVKNRIVVLARPEGRVIMNNDHLKINSHGEETITSLTNETEYFNALKKYFGIELSRDTQFKNNKVEKFKEDKSSLSLFFQRRERANLIPFVGELTHQVFFQSEHNTM